MTGAEGVEVVAGDAGDASATQQACKDASVVYLCAAPPYTDWDPLYPRMQENLIAAAGLAGARLVTAENMYVYGATETPMKEDQPHRPHTRKGKIRAAMSADLLEAHRQGRVQAALGRAPDYFGPFAVETTIYGGRVFYPALSGKKVSVQGKLDALHTWIYVDDFARGLVTLGAHEEALGQTWHLPAPPPLSQRDFVSLIFEEAGYPPRMAETPAFVFKMVGLFVPIMRELEEMLYQWEKPYLVNHDKFATAFGATVMDHRTTIRETLAWFKQHPPK